MDCWVKYVSLISVDACDKGCLGYEFLLMLIFCYGLLEHVEQNNTAIQLVWVAVSDKEYEQSYYNDILRSRVLRDRSELSLSLQGLENCHAMPCHAML